MGDACGCHLEDAKGAVVAEHCGAVFDNKNSIPAEEEFHVEPLRRAVFEEDVGARRLGERVSHGPGLAVAARARDEEPVPCAVGDEFYLLLQIGDTLNIGHARCHARLGCGLGS